MAKKTLSIGGATYDLFVRLPKNTIGDCSETQSFALPLGAKIRVENLIESCGGGANNTSVGLSRLGCSACFEGVVSSDQWGEALLKNLQKEGVDTACITVVENEVSSFSIILSGKEGERVILYEPGTNAHLHDVTFDKDVLQKMDWVYLNHIQEDSCVIQDDIVTMLSSAETGLTWNPGGCQIDMGLTPRNNYELLQNTDLILLNKEEATAFTKTANIESAIQTLLDAGVKNAAITDGKNGSVASDGKNIFSCPTVLDTEVIDTTGAGDAFGTAMTWALLNGLSLPNALKAGSINAASVVGAIGSQTALLTDIEIRKRLEETDLIVERHPL